MVKRGNKPKKMDKVPFQKGRFPLVGSVIGLASGVPKMTIPRFLGMMPSWGWGESMKRRKRLRPVEKGLLSTILKAPVTVPMSPITGVAKLARRVGAIAEEEMDQETGFREALLTLQMEREMGRITEAQYKEKAGNLKKALDELVEEKKEG